TRPPVLILSSVLRDRVLLYAFLAHQPLRPFPTRRSSDLHRLARLRVIARIAVVPPRLQQLADPLRRPRRHTEARLAVGVGQLRRLTRIARAVPVRGEEDRPVRQPTVDPILAPVRVLILVL